VNVARILKNVRKYARVCINCGLWSGEIVNEESSGVVIMKWKDK